MLFVDFYVFLRNSCTGILRCFWICVLRMSLFRRHRYEAIPMKIHRRKFAISLNFTSSSCADTCCVQECACQVRWSDIIYWSSKPEKGIWFEQEPRENRIIKILRDLQEKRHTLGPQCILPKLNSPRYCCHTNTWSTCVYTSDVLDVVKTVTRRHSLHKRVEWPFFFFVFRCQSDSALLQSHLCAPSVF